MQLLYDDSVSDTVVQRRQTEASTAQTSLFISIIDNIGVLFLTIYLYSS